MITKQQLITVAGELPLQFSIEELVSRLVELDGRPTAEQAEQAYYASPEAREVYARFPSSPRVNALKGIAASLSPEDMQKTAKEWEAERIREKYGV